MEFFRMETGRMLKLLIRTGIMRLIYPNYHRYLQEIMNGKDVTDTCCKDGVVEIAKVIGDVTVEIKRAPRTFRWELEDDVFDSVTENGYAANHLTLLEGSIQNSVFSGVKYALAENCFFCPRSLF